MKKLLIVLVVAAAAYFIGKTAFDKFTTGRAVQTAEVRVTGVLHNLARGDQQVALCQWAKGRISMTSEEMAHYSNHFDRFVRSAGWTDPTSWTVTATELEDDGSTVLVTIQSGGKTQTLRVEPGEPIEMR